MPKELWQTISMHPLTGLLDTRSRPAEIPAGALRWKLNLRTTREGKLCRRGGWARAFRDKDGGNYDHHRQNAIREPITFGFEATDPVGGRHFYDGTRSRISVLNEGTGVWTDIATGYGDINTNWKAAYSNNYILFTNNVDDVLIHEIGSGSTSVIPDLQGRGVRAAAIVVEFQGILLLMNVFQDNKRWTSRIIWNDLNAPLSWSMGEADTLAGKQDLDYGDEILAAAPLMNALYIYTRRAIWRCNASSDTTKVFTFTRVYSEPKNQSRCLAFPETLVSTGDAHYYMSRDGICHFTPYLPYPEMPEWLHYGSGVIYTKPDTAINLRNCSAPIAEYIPITKELVFSWPGGALQQNSLSLFAQLDHQTCDVVDEGFSFILNYRRNPADPLACNESQSVFAVSAKDWCWKELGWGGVAPGNTFNANVMYREHVVLGQVIETDIPLEATYTRDGYYSDMRGLIPLGMEDRDKKLRFVLLDDDVTAQDDPPVYRLQIGDSFNLRDTNALGDECVIRWDDHGTQPVACVDGATMSMLKSKNLRPNIGKRFNMLRRGRFLYFWLRIEAANGSAPIGGDTYLTRLDFDILVMPKKI